MDDLIKRKDAIDAVAFGITYAKVINQDTGEQKELFTEGNEELNRAIQRIREIPGAHVENVKQGKWFKKNNTRDSSFDGSAERISICSVCGYAREQYDFRYCPNCGAKMEG